MIEYTHRIVPRARSMRITIKKDGSVLVTTPRLVPKFLVNKFVADHATWIDAQRATLAATKEKLTQNEKDVVLLFGEKRKIIVTPHGKKIGVREEGNTLIVTPVGTTHTSLEHALERYLKSTAQQYIAEQTAMYAKKMQTTYGQVSYKQQATRWGSCSSLGNLNFNWRLVHAPKPVIDYVIIHELAHRTHMDHSVAFWKLVERFDPEYRIHRGWLKRNGMGLG